MQLPRQKWSSSLRFCVVITLLAAARAAAGDVVQDATVEVAAIQTTRVRTAVIGADGPELTQVDQAQKLGLSGKDITICVIDTGVDIRHPTFGKDCPDGPACRLAFGYDVESQGTDPTPSDWANAGGHGTHVSGIALGGFPHKLKDIDGNVLPYQRGVAFGAKLGAIRASTESSEFPYDYTRQALEKTIAKKCDIDNMSLGGYYVTPSKQLTPTVAKITAADIIITAAQGNDDQALQTGARVFNAASPGAFDEVFSIGHVNNTANPGSILELDKPVATASGKRTTRIVANQRADTQSSLCNPDCSSLNLPRDIILIKMVPRDAEEGEDPKDAACDMETVTKTKHAHSKGHVILLQISAPCKAYQNAQEIWDLLHTLKPVLVLITLPTEEDSNVGPLYYRNKQTPVLWLRQGDGQGLAAALIAAPEKPIRLLDVPGAELVPVKDEFAGQPATTSALGPGYDLTMKPDISAPGSLYSSLPNSTYQTWPGTSMAAPYMAGVIALWKESVKKQGIKKPKEGWIRAAHIALKNTARPLPYKGSDKLMWSPVKVGSGVVQAYNAVINMVKITPTQLLVRTDVTSQKFTLSVSNTGDTDVIYKLSHKPAVTLHLPRTWYGDGFDASLPVAQLAVMKKVVTVPAKETVKIEVKITVPETLTEVDGIYGGYILFTPTTDATSSAWHTAAVRSKGARAFSAATALPSGPVPLSVPYQGSSKDYSTLGEDDSLVLFVPPMYDVDKTSSEALESKPPLFLCNVDGAGKCGYTEKTLKAPMSEYKSFRFASTLVRPVADVKVQVWSEDGKKLLGTSPSQGPGGTAPPLRRTYLTANSWDGKYFPKGSDESDTTELKQLQAGHKYKLKLLLYPVLAAADRLADREVSLEPLVYELDTKLHVVNDSIQEWEDTNPAPETKATTKSRKAAANFDPSRGGNESDDSGSDKGSSGSRASGRGGNSSNSNGKSSNTGSRSSGSRSGSSSGKSGSGSRSTGSGSGSQSGRSNSNSNSSGGGSSSKSGASSKSNGSSSKSKGSSSGTKSGGSSSNGSNGSSASSSRRGHGRSSHAAAAVAATSQVSRVDLLLDARTRPFATLQL